MMGTDQDLKFEERVQQDREEDFIETKDREEQDVLQTTRPLKPNKKEKTPKSAV